MVISLGAAAFWIALAAVLIAGGWNKVRREQLKQETLLKLIERTGQLNEEQVRLLFPPPPPWPSPHERPWWAAPPDPLAGRRALRVGGLIVMAVAAGLAVLFAVMLNFGTVPQQTAAVPGLGAAGLVGCLALGLLISSNFARGPDRRDEQP